MLCLSQPPDDVVQINVYGATLAGMLNKGVNIHSFLSSNGYGDCVIFDVPRRDTKNRPPYLISSLRDSHLLKSLIEGAEEVEAESPQPRSDREIRSSTAAPGEIIDYADDPLLNCSLSTIPGDSRQIFFPEEEEFEDIEPDPNVFEGLEVAEEQKEEERTLEEPGRIAPIVPEVREEEQRTLMERAPVPIRRPEAPKPYDPFDTRLLDESFTINDDVIDCVIDLVAKACTKATERENGQVPELLEVEEDDFQMGDVFGISLLNGFEELSVKKNDLGDASMDPFAAPDSDILDFPDVEEAENVDLQMSDSTLPANGALLSSFDEDEFFDCVEEEDDDDVMVIDVQENVMDFNENDRRKQKRASDRRNAEAKKVPCQQCNEIVVWKARAGKRCFTTHVRKHFNLPTLKCKFCSFEAIQDSKILYHHHSAHKGVRYEGAVECGREEDTKKLLKLWHECFPGVPVAIKLAAVGSRPPSRRSPPT